MIKNKSNLLLLIVLAILCAAEAEAGRSMGFEVVGTRYYITGIGLWALGLVYLPLLLMLIGLAYALVLRLLPKRIKWSLVVLLLIGGGLLPFVDVYLIGQEAKTLCKDAGLKVYKTVKTEGFIGASSIKLWSEYGFEFVEHAGSERINHRTLVNGEEHQQYLDQPMSRYSARSKSHEVVNLHFARSRLWTEDIQTKEVLGELVTYSIYPGWVDSLVIPALGGSFTPWICGKWVPEELQDRYGQTYGLKDVILDTLKAPHLEPETDNEDY